MNTGQKHAVVTGSASGIGLAIARRLCAEGWSVTGIDIRSSDEVDTAVGVDLTDWSAAEAELDRVAGDRAIDALVNCAGVQVDRGPVTELDVSALDRLYSHNLRPSFQMVNWALPRLAPGASIANIGSISGAATVPGLAAYGAIKAALHSYSRSLAAELGPRGFRVNVVAPGYVETPLTAVMLEDESRVAELQARIPMRRISSPDEIAAAVGFLLSPQASYINGAVLPVDGGYLA